MSERLTKIQNRVERASEVLSLFGEDSIAVMVGEDGGAVVFPKGLSAYAALLVNAREDLEYLLIENAALRTRVEQAESALAEIADVLNQELRENGGDRFQVNGIGEDMLPAIRVLVDCVNHRAEAERDALRAEAGRLREALGKADEAFQAIGAWLYEENPPGGAIVGEQIRKWEKVWFFNRRSREDLSAPLSSAAVERWKAMERVVEAADALEAIIKAELPEGPSMDTDRDAQVRRLCFEVFTGLAALDRTGETRKE